MKLIVQIAYLLRKHLINNHYKCYMHTSLFSEVIFPFQWIPCFNKSLRVRYNDSLAWWPLRGGLGKWCCGCSSPQFLHFFLHYWTESSFSCFFRLFWISPYTCFFHSLVNTKTDLTGLHPLNEQWLTGDFIFYTVWSLWYHPMLYFLTLYFYSRVVESSVYVESLLNISLS